MAQIRRVITVCDLHDGDVGGARTIFVIAERIYTIDTCPVHRTELQAAVGVLRRALAAHRATASKQTGTRRRPAQVQSHGKR
jgi:hypothetical protein